MRLREHKYEWDILLVKCTKCGEYRRIDDFYKKASYQFWIRSQCKECERAYKEENRERYSLYFKEYHQANKQRHMEMSRIYRENNRDKIREKWRQYNRDNKEKIAEYRRRFRAENKNLVSEREKRYKDNYTEELWFNRRTFHEKTRKYAIKYNLRPDKCPICWNADKIQMHHPSYDVYEDWSYVVFCCPTCHAGIHAWLIECPKPINLLTLK